MTDLTLDEAEDHQGQATEDLDALGRGLGGRHYPSIETVTARVVLIAGKRRVGDYLRHSLGHDASGAPTLSSGISTRRPSTTKGATDGWCCLLTNLDPGEADAGEVLARYKGQEVVERRYGAFKGPLAVAPIFLKSNRRIEALLTVMADGNWIRLEDGALTLHE